MPTYFARGVSVHLGVSSLLETTTCKVVLRKGEVAKQQCEKADRRLLQSEPLQEERIMFPGDTDGFELNWVGDAPFMQNLVGKHLFEQSSGLSTENAMAKSNHSSLQQQQASNNDYRTDHQPLALSLHVKLSDKTFISGLTGLNKVHLKIDVFFNGQLSGCSFVPTHDIRSGSKSRHQVFAGHRVDYLSERPWVILPPTIDANDGPRNETSLATVEQRWKQICGALAFEAKARGVDNEGNCPPSSKFLGALASMQMPEQIKHNQKSGGRSFGIIDVVITAGNGRKVTVGTSYLNTPQRLVDGSFPILPSQICEEGQAIRPRTHVAPKHGFQEILRSIPELSDKGVDDNSVRKYESPSNRRAIVPEAPPPRPDLKTLARNPFKDASSPPILTPALATPTPSASRSHAHISTSSYKHRRVGSTLTTQREMRVPVRHADDTSSTQCTVTRRLPYGTPPSLCSIPDHGVHTANMCPSIYSDRAIDPMLLERSYDSLPSLTSAGHAAVLSSPLQCFPLANDGNMTRPFLNETRLSGNLSSQIQSVSLHKPMLAAYPDSMRRNSDNPIYAQPFLPLHIPGSRLDQQDPSPSIASPAFTSPILFMPATSKSDGLSLHASYVGLFDGSYLPSVLLPPKGLYRVTTKPRSGHTTTRKLTTALPDKTQQHLYVKRLLVLGMNGTVVIDHKLSSTRCITATRKVLPDNCTSESFDLTSMGDSLALKNGNDLLESPQDLMLNTKANARLEQCNVECIHTANKGGAGKIVEDVLTGNTNAPAALNKEQSFAEETPVNPAPEAIENDSAHQDTKNILQVEGLSTGCTTRATMPQRRIASSGILGVQGPKATTFWLEDPEEVMREAARLRRSRSPKKTGSVFPSQVAEAAVPRLDKDAAEAYVTRSSSPLSSLSHTPEPQADLDPSRLKVPSTPASPASTSQLLPQLDGSPERQIALSTLHKPQSSSFSPHKLNASSTPYFPPPTATSGSLLPSPSPTNKKKRKTHHKSPAKPPRSPYRIKTTDNPPLNKNCVIAFAESRRDKDGGGASSGGEAEQAVLRQVKGERQGVFSEEYVVFATRFYVVGE